MPTFHKVNLIRHVAASFYDEFGSLSQATAALGFMKEESPMSRAIQICIAIFVISFSDVSYTAEYSGLPVKYEMLPKETVQLIPIEVTTDQFKARLKAGGTIVFDGNEFVLDPPDPTKKSTAFIAVDRLELKNGAKIITNGNRLVVLANTIASDNGQIVSFKDAEGTARAGAVASSAPGSAGNPGSPGLSGGVVSLHVVQGVEGQLKVVLRGQFGGAGSAGKDGAQGPGGGKGADAQDGPGGWLTPGWCKSGGQPGGAGGKGYAGGAGGPGGPGGEGGYFELVNVGASPTPAAAYRFEAPGGKAGPHGQPGEGGPGGPGGGGGNGSTWCGGGPPGPPGPQGDRGTVPAEPSPDGVAGKDIVKNLDLEVAIRTSIIANVRPSDK